MSIEVNRLQDFILVAKYRDRTKFRQELQAKMDEIAEHKAVDAIVALFPEGDEYFETVIHRVGTLGPNIIDALSLFEEMTAERAGALALAIEHYGKLFDGTQYPLGQAGVLGFNLAAIECGLNLALGQED